VPVAKKLICKGFERYSRQSFCPNVGYLHNSKALFCTDEFVLDDLSNEADTKGNMLEVPTKLHFVHRGDTTKAVLRD